MREISFIVAFSSSQSRRANGTKDGNPRRRPPRTQTPNAAKSKRFFFVVVRLATKVPGNARGGREIDVDTTSLDGERNVKANVSVTSYCDVDGPATFAFVCCHGRSLLHNNTCTKLHCLL